MESYLVVTEEERELVLGSRAVNTLFTEIESEMVLELVDLEVRLGLSEMFRIQLAERLRWRRLKWSHIPEPCRLMLMPFLTVRDTLFLDTAMAEKEARKHLLKAYVGLRSVAFDEYWYTGRHDFKGLRWVMGRGIDVQNLNMKYRGESCASKVLRELVLGFKKDIATYFAERSKAEDTVSSNKWISTMPRTTLLEAATYGMVEVVQCLISRGADANKDCHGDTPLYRASYSGHLAVVRLLLAAGASPNLSHNNGWAPLYWASFSGHVDVVRALLDAGADVNKRNYQGRTPLSVATDFRHPQVAALLRDAGGHE